MMNLGNRIRELRKKNNVTQEQLANALNLSPQAGTDAPQHTLDPASRHRRLF